MCTARMYFVLVLLLQLSASLGKTRFDHTTVVKVLPKRSEDIDLLKSVTSRNSVDAWSRLPLGNATMLPFVFSVDIVDKSLVLNTLQRSHASYSILTENLQEWVDEEERQIAEKENSEEFDYENYHTYEDILFHLEWLSKKYPERVNYQSIGQTIESRQIPLVVVKAQNSTTAEDVLFECGIHARERVSPSTCMWVLKEILAAESDFDLGKRFNFHFIPVVNPDGYSFTFTHNRSWRKNRRKQILPLLGHCYGVDLNRNFDSNFCQTRGGAFPCSNTYCGRHAFSEKETLAVRDYVLKLNEKGTLKVYLAVHSYSQLWMYPYGIRKIVAENQDKLEELSKIAAEATSETHGVQYQSGPIPKFMGEIGGTSLDWVHSATNCKLTFVAELRDKGRLGFILPPSQIRPTGEEYWNGVKALLRAV